MRVTRQIRAGFTCLMANMSIAAALLSVHSNEALRFIRTKNHSIGRCRAYKQKLHCYRCGGSGGLAQTCIYLSGVTTLPVYPVSNVCAYIKQAPRIAGKTIQTLTQKVNELAIYTAICFRYIDVVTRG